MSVIRRSVGLSAASKYTQFLLVLVSNVVIARLLTPGEIGVYAIAAVLAGIAQLFRDMGIGQYLIREPELDEGKIRVAFTLMASVAWCLGAALALISGPVAVFYGESSLGPVLRIQALSFLIIPFGAISLTLLKRDFHFGRVYMVDLGSNLAHVVVAIALAWRGFGPESLAWASVAAVAVTSVGAVLARRGRFVYRPTLRGARAVLGFGGFVTATQVLGTLNRDIPELIIGKWMGMSSLAFFSKAMLPTSMFSQLVMGALNPVLLPAFSKKSQENDVHGPLLHGLACLTAIVVPGLALVAFLSDWIVMILFGPQWSEAVDPMRVFAVSTAVWSCTAIFSSLLVALGYPRAPLNVQLIAVPVRIALIALAVPYGLLAIAFAWLISGVLASIIQFRQVSRLAGIPFRDMASAIAPSVYCGSPLAGLIGVLVWWLDPEVTVPHALLVLTGSGLTLSVAWYAALAALSHPLYHESISLLDDVKSRSRGYA